MNAEERSLLSKRPQWMVTRVFMWLTVAPVILVFVGYAFSWWAMWEAERFIAASDNTVDYGTPWDWGYDLYDLAGELIWLIPTVGTLWLLASVADKLDQLVWLNASDEDRCFIMAKRKGRKSE